MMNRVRLNTTTMKSRRAHLNLFNHTLPGCLVSTYLVYPLTPTDGQVILGSGTKNRADVHRK